MKKLIYLSILVIMHSLVNAQDSANDEEKIKLVTQTGDIFGTLTIPANTSEKVPIALIIAGSGPTDRNGNAVQLKLNTNAYKILAEDLATEGIATLRFDKRGIGESKGAMLAEKDLRFDNYIEDVVAWVNLIKEDERFDEIFIIGHSEGSLIGMAAANKVKVQGFISLAGAGEPADKIVEDQLAQSPYAVESGNIIARLKTGDTVDDISQNLLALYRPSVQPYLISWFKYDPQAELQKLEAPSLIIQGTTDLQVKTKNAEFLAAANPNAKMVIIEEMNHVLKEATENPQANMATYFNPDLPLKEGLVSHIASFILAE